MIKKFDTYDLECDSHISHIELAAKINEIIDVVNKLDQRIYKDKRIYLEVNKMGKTVIKKSNKIVGEQG